MPSHDVHPGVFRYTEVCYFFPDRYYARQHWPGKSTGA